jgi:hypothetical protein
LKWKKWEFDFGRHPGKDKISLIVRATDDDGKKYLVSAHGLKVEKP